MFDQLIRSLGLNAYRNGSSVEYNGVVLGRKPEYRSTDNPEGIFIELPANDGATMVFTCTQVNRPERAKHERLVRLVREQGLGNIADALNEVFEDLNARV